MSNPTETMQFSVIVPIYNRSRKLQTLLEVLSRQSLPSKEFEVVLCDDGSTEDLGLIVQAAILSYSLNIRHLRQARNGPASARNLGLAEAQGQIIASIDSDCLPEPGWLHAFQRAFDEPDISFAGGPLSYCGAHCLSGRCVGFLMTSTLGAAGATDPRRALSMKFYPCAGNMAVRRKHALAVGGFPNIPYNEDTEFAARIQRLGIRPIFVPEAAVLHDECSGLVRIVRENFLKGSCRVRHVDVLNPRTLIPAMPAFLVLYLIVLGVSLLLWPWLGPWIKAPLMLYLIALGILAIQGGLILADFRAALAVPIYAFAMHLGYGCGFLAARLRLSQFLPKSWSLDEN